MLTGTAGDGKSHLCGKIWRRLGGSDGSGKSRTKSTTGSSLGRRQGGDGSRAPRPDGDAAGDPAGRYADKQELLARFSRLLFAPDREQVFLWRKNWRFAGGLAASTIVAGALSISLYGYQNHVDYLSVLQFLSKHGEYQHLNQSVDGLLVRWLYHGPSLHRDPNGFIPQSAFPPYMVEVYIPTILSSLVMLIIPFVVRSKGIDRTSRLLDFCNASTLFTMASPIAWAHHYNILLPIYVVALKAAFDRWEDVRLLAALALLATSFILTGFYPLKPASDVTDPSRNLAESHVFFGALALVGIMLVEMRAPVTSRDVDSER